MHRKIIVSSDRTTTRIVVFSRMPERVMPVSSTTFDHHDLDLSGGNRDYNIISLLISTMSNQKEKSAFNPDAASEEEKSDASPQVDPVPFPAAVGAPHPFVFPTSAAEVNDSHGW